MRKVITYGTFDLLHNGHINILKRAKELGDHLTVGLSTDEFNLLKGKSSYHSYENRKLILSAIRYVDSIIPETNWNQKISDINQHNIDLFVMGDDWVGEFDNLSEYCKVIYLPRTVGISTAKIKKDIRKTQNG